ncbi:MAG: sigma-54 interaction domain-containing protein, partial [Fibrobacterota bacterium]
LSPGDRFEIGETAFIFDFSATGKEKNSGVTLFNFDTLNKFAQYVGKERNLNKLLKKLMTTLMEIFSGTDAFIFKFDPEGKPQLFVSSKAGVSKERFSDTVVQATVSSGDGLLIPNALSDPEFSQSQSIADLKLNTVMCAPIKVAGKMLGVVYIGSNKALVSYTKDDLQILTVYATIAGMLVNHVEYISYQDSAIQKLSGGCVQDGVVYESKVMHELLGTVQALAQSDITVLIEGQTGTGKSLVAQAIHRQSRRSTKPFVVINCSSIQGELLESELFGHRKGSFTGAVNDHEGLFASADGGTIFLDEIGELDGRLQAKLLRTLETGMIRPIGSTVENKVDVRVVCATNRSLSQMVRKGEFRADLFYRIEQLRITLPPLCERGDDAVLIAYHFLEKFKSMYSSCEVLDFHPEALDYIRTYAWPGNIRELSNAVHRAVLMSKGPLLKLDSQPLENPLHREKKVTDLEEATRLFQKKLITDVVNQCSGNKEEAIKKLGLSRSTFFRYQAQLGL